MDPFYITADMDSPSRSHSSVDSDSSLFDLSVDFSGGSALSLVLSSYEDNIDGYASSSGRRSSDSQLEEILAHTIQKKPSKRMLGMPSHGKSRWSPSKASKGIEPVPPEIAKVILKEWDAREWHQSSDALTQWLNERWRKTGYQVSPQTVCWTLKAAGRDAQMGLGDPENGAFLRCPSSEDLLRRASVGK